MYRIKQKSVLVLAMLLSLTLLASVSFYGCSAVQSAGPDINKGFARVSEQPAYKPSTLEESTGQGQPASDGKRQIAVMVENSFAARPQSGLNLADIVFEVVDEYGITRFVAIYSTNDAPMVGPVRSARPYYAEIARAFNPIYAFFGTFPQCYKVIQDMGMQVLSAMSDRSGMSSITAQAPYWRDWTRSSIQEHTAFMSVAQLRQKASQLGYQSTGNIPFIFKPDPPLNQRGDVSNITISFATHAYAPRGFDLKYTYDKNLNAYLRNMGGYPHIDYNTGQQITTKNVVVMVTDITGPLDKYGHMGVRTIGRGTAFIFQDGKAIRGTWERPDVYSPFVYKADNGSQVSFTGGATWIAMVQGEDKVGY